MKHVQLKLNFSLCNFFYNWLVLIYYYYFFFFYIKHIQLMIMENNIKDSWYKNVLN